ncbi:hypothetical protein ACFQ1S_09530, partial [Kibdelosporangium lantanae]
AATFVDEPQTAVREAETLVGKLMDELKAHLDEQKRSLSGERTDTEELRIALRRYRSLADQILAQPTISLTFYEAYETGAGNDAEFQAASADFARTYKTLGMAGGTLAQGIAIAVKNRDDVEQAITSVDQTVHALTYERQQANPDTNTVQPTIGTVAIFAHGVRRSLGLDPQGETGPNWFKAAQIKTFVAAVRGHVAGNVRFLLFACSTGGSENEKQGMPTQDEAGGEGSFAQLLAQELGGEATVYAHNVAGHTESNPLARTFTADSPTGVQMFDVLYGDEFLNTEATRLALTTPEETANLRKTMWAHYVDAVATDFGRIRTKNRHFTIGGYGGVGAAMFMDPEGTKTVLRDDFTTVWLTNDRVKKLRTP